MWKNTQFIHALAFLFFEHENPSQFHWKGADNKYRIRPEGQRKGACMYICLCKAVSEQKIRKLIERGAATLKEIQQESQAGTNCGTCVCYIQDIIREFKTEREETPPPPQNAGVSSPW